MKHHLLLGAFLVACSGSPAASDDASGGEQGATSPPASTTTPPSTTAPGTTSPAPVPAGAVRLTADQKKRAEQLTSVFENGTIDIDYAYIEDIDDGRGFTIGRGFTTATGDADRVIANYLKVVPTDPLSKFLPELDRLAREESGDTDGLKGFQKAWQTASKTDAMHKEEDAEVDRASYDPACQFFDQIGGQKALTLVVLYDSVFMHGDGDDPDGVPALIKTATDSAGGTPKTGVDEHKWLGAFIAARRADLANAHDPETRQAWAEAVGRADEFQELLDQGNDDLHGPIQVGHGYDVNVP